MRAYSTCTTHCGTTCWCSSCLLRFPETVTAISFELQGVYDQAQESYEQAMKRARDLHNVGPAPFSIIPEYKLWEDHWCKYVTFFFLYFCLSFFSSHPNMCFIMLSSFHFPSLSLLSCSPFSLTLLCHSPSSLPNLLRCARELGQWDTLTEFGKAHAGTNPFLGM